MTVVMTLKDWRGEAVKGALRGAVAGALNDTAADAVQVAQNLAPRDTGFMANTIEVVAKAQPDRLEVTWGNITAEYTIWQEIGSRGRPGRYFLKGAADQAYPGLFKRLSGLRL